MAWALTQQIVTEPTARHVLLCLANYAGEDGRGAFPAVSTLSKLTGLSERTVQYKLAALEEARVIRRGNQAVAAAYIDRNDRRPTVYDLDLRGAADAPRAERGATDDANGVQLATERGARVAPDPSLNHPVKPDIEGVATAAGRACLLMRRAGCATTNPAHPDLLAALSEGVTPEALAATVTEAIDGGIQRPFAYAITTARSRHAKGATTITGANHATPVRLSAVERVRANVIAAERRDAEAAGSFTDANVVASYG